MLGEKVTSEISQRILLNIIKKEGEIMAEKKNSYLIPALILVASVAALITMVGVIKCNVAVSLMIIGIITIFLAQATGTKWDTIAVNIGEAINTVYIGVFIMMLVGMLIASWMAAGTVPLLMYYGLKWLSPSIFLVATCILCSLMSILTGTSWGTIGTMGIALIGVSKGLGVNELYTIGAVVTGALIGDKMSPLSDTTILAPTVSGTDVYKHIRSMFYTTGPAFLISIIMYAILGINHTGNTVVTESYTEIMSTLAANFNMNILSLIPPILVVTLIVMKKPSIPTFGIGIFAGCIVAAVVQGRGFKEIVGFCANGFSMDTGSSIVNSMVNRGGLLNMMSTIAVIIAAALFSGALKSCGVFEMLCSIIKSMAKGQKSVLGSSYILHFLLYALTGSYFVTFSIVGPMMGPIFDEYDIDRRNLSRMLEDTGTTSAPLIPWSTFSVYVAGALGVSAWSYVLYCPLSYFGLITAAVYILTGFGIFRKDGTMLCRAKKAPKA